LKIENSESAQQEDKSTTAKAKSSNAAPFARGREGTNVSVLMTIQLLYAVIHTTPLVKARRERQTQKTQQLVSQNGRAKQ
jgi:hypothetical protein